MTFDETWAGWLLQFPSREAVEAHAAACPPLPWASAWAKGAPWLRSGGNGDLTVLYLAVVDSRVQARHPGGAEWRELEFGRVGRWRPVTPCGEAVRATSD